MKHEEIMQEPQGVTAEAPGLRQTIPDVLEVDDEQANENEKKVETGLKVVEVGDEKKVD